MHTLYVRPIGHCLVGVTLNNYNQSSHSPSPDVQVGFQGEEQIGEQALVHQGPLELWDAKHGGPWTRAELSSLLFGHRHSSEAQVHAQISVQMIPRPAVQTLEEKKHIYDVQS